MYIRRNFAGAHVEKEIHSHMKDAERRFCQRQNRKCSSKTQYFLHVDYTFPSSNIEFKIIPQSTQLLLRTTAVTEKENLFHYFCKIVNSTPVLVGGVSECL